MDRAGQGGRPNYTRDERKHMIISAIAIAIQNGEYRWFTPYKLARKIGMTNCPSFRHFVTELETEGRIERRSVERAGRWAGHEFSLAEGTYTDPKKRDIPVKAKGEQIGQLSLW